MSCMGSSFNQLIVGLDCQGGHHCVSSPHGSPEQGRKSLGEAWALLLFPENIQGGQSTHKWFHHLSGGVGASQLNGLALLWSSQKVVTSFLATSVAVLPCLELFIARCSYGSYATATEVLPQECPVAGCLWWNCGLGLWSCLHSPPL